MFEKGVKSLGKFIRGIPRLFPALGKLLGPIYLIIEGVIGIFTGFKESLSGEGNFMEKFIKGLFFSVRNFVSNVIGGTLDLLKDAVAFIIDIFGGDPESGFLKEFKDFSIKDLIMDFYNVLKEPFLFIKDLLLNFGIRFINLYTQPSYFFFEIFKFFNIICVIQVTSINKFFNFCSKFCIHITLLYFFSFKYFFYVFKK